MCPKTDSCGTPQVILKILHAKPLIDTNTQFQSLNGHFLFLMACVPNVAGWTLNSTESILKNSFW